MTTRILAALALLRTWRTLVLLVLLVQLVYYISFSSDQYFFSDDFLNFLIAKDMGLTTEYVGHDCAGQFLPGYRLVNWAYVPLFGMNYGPARCAMAVMTVIPTAMAMQLVRRHRIDASTALPLMALLIFSPLTVPNAAWWSAGLVVLPSVACGAAAIVIANRDRFGRREIALVSSFCFVAVLFYAKTPFLVILLYAIRLYSLRRQGHPPGSAGLAALREIAWPACIMLAYLAVVFFGGYRSPFPLPTVREVSLFLWRGWNEGFLKAAFGLREAFPGRLVFMNAAVALVVAGSIRLAREAIFPWIGFALYFIVTTTVVALARIGAFGMEAAEGSRYFHDAFVYFVTTALIVNGMPEADVGRVALARRETSGASRVATALSLICSVAVAAYFISIAGDERPSWYPEVQRARRFTNNVAEGVARVPPGEKVADGPLPPYILQDWIPFVKWDTYGHFVSLFSSDVIVAPAAEATWRFDGEGRLTRMDR